MNTLRNLAILQNADGELVAVDIDGGEVIGRIMEIRAPLSVLAPQAPRENAFEGGGMRHTGDIRDRQITNKFPGRCRKCNNYVEAHAGLWSKNGGTVHEGPCPPPRPKPQRSDFGRSSGSRFGDPDEYGDSD